MESKEGCFSFKSLYGVLEGVRMGPSPRNIIWNPYLPTKVSFFAWEVLWGRVMTLDQFKKRGRHLINRCPLCDEDEENIDHLLLLCKKAR